MGIFDDRFFDEARRYEQMLGLGDLAQFRQSRMIEDIINPPWRREIDKLMDSGAVSLYRALQREHVPDFVGSNAFMSDLYGGAALAEAVKAATMPTWERLALESNREFCTLDGLAGHKHLDQIVKQLSAAEYLTQNMEAILANASRIHEPWLDLHDAARSFEALGMMRQLGQALASPDFFHSDTREQIDQIVGHWVPEDPMAFTSLSLEARREKLRDAGFDSRLTAVPAPAYPDALWASGIGPLSRPRRTASSLVVVVSMTPADYAFAIVRRVERALRRFIEAELHSRYGDGWIAKIVPKEMRDRWEKVRVGRGHANRPLSLRDSELGDLLQLIVRNDLWREVFRDRAATHREEIQVSMSRLIAVRRPAAHSDDVGSEELLICATEGRHLLRNFGLPIPWRVEEQVVYERPHETPGGWIVVVCKQHQDPLAEVRDEHRRMCAGVVRRFPYQFDERFFASSPAMDVGWMPVFERLCEAVDQELSEEEKKTFKWHQVKQKLATFRAYFWVGPDDPDRGPDHPRSQLERAIFRRVQTQVMRAQEEAANTCEICGAAPAAIDHTGLYLRTLCSGCVADRRKDFSA